MALLSRKSSKGTEKKTWKSLIPDNVRLDELTKLEKFRLWLTFWTQRLNLDSHHKAERFAITTVALTSTLALVLVMGGISTHLKKSHMLNDTAVYSQEFVSSKTGINGSVDGLYVSPDRKTALLMMKFDDPKQVSTNAKNYQSFLMGSSYDLKQKALKQSVSGQLISFGSTGYLGVELKTGAEDGFSSQIMHLVMRANEQIIAPDQARAQAGAMDDDVERDDTFNTFDQWEIFMNPGSNAAKVLPALGSEKLDVKNVFYDTVTKHQESELRKTLGDDLNALNADLSAIREYKERIESASLDGARLTVPELPKQVQGDEMTCVGQQRDKNSVSQKVSCDPEKMRYHPKWVAPNGFNFDWQDGSIEKGYLDQVVPKGESTLSWFADHRSSSDGESMPVMDTTEWKFSNGRTLGSYMKSGGSDVGPIQDLNSSIGLLQSSMDQYYQNKIKYQVTDLGDLLGAEMALMDVADNHTINAEKDVAVRVLQ